MNVIKGLALSLLLFLCTAANLNAQSRPTGKPASQDPFRLGHSTHGDAFDEGPREKPWIMEGIGKTHFPITTSNPEVQMWFDQGHTMLHNFWYYEAERAFRWCLKLDPECAMAYWGLARVTTFGKPSAAAGNERSAAFIKEAAKRKDKVTERERLYIEAWEELWKDEPKDQGAQDSSKKKEDKFRLLLERICLKYPQDIEAKALFALESLWQSSRNGNELILQQVLSADIVGMRLASMVLPEPGGSNHPPSSLLGKSILDTNRSGPQCLPHSLLRQRHQSQQPSLENDLF